MGAEPVTGPSTAVAEVARPAPLRSDIQGLRAVSVLVVIAAHAGWGLVAGGYVGVDVFFVISGFLITGLLIREAERGTAPSLRRFYARRARRILPAATVVLVATCIATVVFLPVVRGTEILRDAWWSALFAANIRFAVVETDYFAADRPTSPLQHYWSLSVEEQFYLVWPLLLVLLASVAAARRLDLRRLATTVLAVLTAASLGWSVWATHHSPDTAYFSTLTRAWELGAGALLALVAHRTASTGQRRAESRAPAALVQGLALLGAGLVLGAALLFEPSSPVPGVLAAVPVLGAVLVLLAGGLPSGERTVVARVLSTRPLRVLGDWSYSLYLWHFPVLVIARSHAGGLSGVQVLLCLVAILALSAATYHLVEQPFRTGWRWKASWPALTLYPVGLVVVLVAVVGSTSWLDHRLGRNDGNPPIEVADFSGRDLSADPATALVQASVLAAKQAQPVPGVLVPGLLDIRDDTAPLGDCDYRTGTRELCPGGDVDAERSIVLIGDSHARAWSPAISAIGSAEGYRTYALVYTGCPANQAIRLDPETGRDWRECEDFVAWTLETIESLSPDLVVISNAPLGPVVDVDTGETVTKVANTEEFTRAVDAGLQREIELITPYAEQVTVLANTPKLPREQAVCLSDADDLGECLLTPEPGARRIQQGFAAVAASAGATYVDAEKWFCFKRRCPSVVGSFVPMRDSEHMTTSYAAHLAMPLAVALGLSDRA